MLFGNALDPTGRANHPKLASARPHANQMGTVLAKDKPVWRSRYNETSITGHTRRVEIPVLSIALSKKIVLVNKRHEGRDCRNIRGDNKPLGMILKRVMTTK